MSIFVIQGPAAPQVSRPHIPASPSGAPPIDVIRCDGVVALIGGLHLARCQRAQLVVLDAGELSPRDCTLHAAAMKQALDALQAPYIELHDRCTQEFALWARPSHAALAVFNLDHDAGARYAMAMAIAARLTGDATPAAGLH